MSADQRLIVDSSRISTAASWPDVVAKALMKNPFEGLTCNSDLQDIDDCVRPLAIECALDLCIRDAEEVCTAIDALVAAGKNYCDSLPSRAIIDPLLDAWGSYHEERRGSLH